MKLLIKSLKMLRHVHWLMLLAAGLLLYIGVRFIYSSCYIGDGPVRTLWLRQVVWIVVGGACYFALAAADYRYLGKISPWLYLGSIFLLIAVLFLGEEVHSAKRRLDILGVSVQPSELAKLATILVLARELSRPGVVFKSLRSMVPLLFLAIVPVMLVMKQPDLGTAMVFLPTALVMMLVARVHPRALGVLALLGVLLAGVVLGAAVGPKVLGMPEEEQLRIWKKTTLSPYQRKRILVYVGLDEEPLRAGWNKRQSLIAVGSGGLRGKGYLQGTQNILGFLPSAVAPTDFIYSVIAEEKGFIGSTVVLALFGVLVYCGMRAAMEARDRMGRLLCAGIVTLLFCHVFINIAMTVGLMPITGLPLPLLSYGGSFTVVMMSALGIVQSVHIRSLRLGQVL